tara:strand:- start:859 stop:2850 length:1992 start_codon:yes stop_codon:yes gene_type:complete
MEFKLSESLSSTLIQYDTTLKREAAKAKRSKNVKKKKHQFGNINDLIPFDVVPAEEQQYASNHINQSLCAGRHYQFYGDKEKNILIGFVYHYESLWVACWLPWSIKDKCFAHRDSIGQDYIYGFSFAHRNNDSTISKVGKAFCNGYFVNPDYQVNFGRRYKYSQHQQQRLEHKQIGRSKFLFKQVFVTRSMVQNGFIEEPWDSPSEESDISSWHEKSRDIKRVVQSWENKLSKRVLQYDRDSGRGYHSNSATIWERLIGNNNSLHYLFKLQYETRLEHVVKVDSDYNHSRSTGRNWYDERGRQKEILRQQLVKEIIPDNFVADYESIIKIFKEIKEYEILFKYNFFDKKFIKRTITEGCNKINSSFEVSNTILTTKEERNIQKILAPILKLDSYLNHIVFIYRTWEDKIPFDYLQNIDVLASVDHPDCHITYQTNKGLYTWLRNNMPISSYIQLITTFYQLELDKWHEKDDDEFNKYYNYNKFTDTHDFRFSDLNDSINMLNRLVKTHGQDFKKPKRWRIQEFHDYVTAESWKLSNVKENLPQDLFPEPVKATLDLNGALNIMQMTFFQPRDTHQLAEWGRAVRNCVGSAGYSERIRKKKNFIVLAMIENKPRYTIQLSLDRGILHVDQIADVSNTQLDDQQRSDTQKLFKEALKIRGNESTD